MHRWLMLALLAACGPGASSQGNAVTAPGPGTTASDATSCADLALEYRNAFLTAVACDPSAPDACTEWRPITVAVGSSTSDAKITGLCFTSGVGYVTPQQTAPLDALVAKYKAAGCALSFCPGPSTNQNRCTANAAKQFTCGGV